MAIKKRFAGKVIRKPGSYSRWKTDNSAGAPTLDTGVLMIVGESTLGAPGDSAGIVEFSAERLDFLIETYGSGPIVDCAVAAARPSKQQGVSGVSKFLVWKTNSAVQASVYVPKSSSNIFSVKDRAWGLPGNDLAVVIANGTNTGTQKLVSITKLGDTTESLGENDGSVVMTIVYAGNSATATLTIAGNTQAAKTLTTTLSGSQTDGSVNLNILLKNYTMKTLVDFINTKTGYTASLSTVSLASTNAKELDPVTATVVKTTAASFYRIQREILDLINTSDRVIATIEEDDVVGLPDNGTLNLSGGVLGASVNSDFSTGFSSSLSEDYNMLLPAISRDASVDIADAKQGFTDAASTYTISSVLTACETHLRLRGDTKNRKEAQGFGGYRSSSKATAFAAIAAQGSELMQICMQDILMGDAAGENRYMHPHVLAALAAGMRGGMEVGEPLTHKYPNILQMGHFIDPDTGLESGDFNPGLDYDDAIDNGVLFLEKAKGGFRWVVDNTTFGQDESFVLNRGSVMGAVHYVNAILRETVEHAFIGKKLPAGGAAKSIKEQVRNKLRELNAPDVNIITSSDDAPEGYVEATFVVTITGNTCRIQVEYKPVQGLDFAFFDFTAGDVSQSA